MSDTDSQIGHSIDATLGATLAGESIAESTLREPRMLARLLDGAVKLVRLRHYVLLERIGQGGMGVVFAAYDETLERKVAVKLLRHVARPEAQRRLIREAQAMARLSHPNVVQIYEIGEVEGLTFIVMEFVDGLTLGAWRKAAPRSRAEILAVFIAAGRGLAAAHDKSLVHRDFKPDNVMISGDGRVRVMDFGIAREHGVAAEPVGPELASLERSGELSVDLTATGALMGTPAYMAPEQFRGLEIDARTDQFSFCVALWEALYGERPFAARSLGALSVAVSSGQLTTPDRSEVPSWLHELLVRGLAVEPDRRHPSMAALLRALQDDPTRRRRLWAIGVGLVALLVAAFVAVAIAERRSRAQTLAACEAEGRAIEANWNSQTKAELRARFEASTSSISSSVWSYIEPRMDAYADSWTRLRVDVCRSTRIDLERDEAAYQATAACLDEQQAIFAALIEAWHDADAQTVGHAPLAAAGLPPVSACQSEAWLAHRVEPPADQRERVIALRVRLHRVAALRLSGSFSRAADEAKLVLDEAEQLGWLPLVAEARAELAEARSELGQYDDARALVEQAFVDAIASGHDRVALESATSATQLIGYFLVDFDAGLYWGRLAVGLLERMGLTATIHEAALRTTVGHVHWARGSHGDALDSYTAALELYEANLGPEHPRVADALGNVGYMHKERGDYDRAVGYYQRALAINEATLGSEHPNVAITLLYLGDIASRRGQHQQALETYHRGLAINERAYGPEHPAVASALNELGWAYANSGQHQQALDHYRRALAINRAAFGPEHPSVASVLNNIATSLLELGDHPAALDAQLEALRINEAAFGPDHTRVATSLVNLAQIHDQLGQHQQASSAAVRALTIFEALTTPEPQLAEIRQKLARALEQ